MAPAVSPPSGHHLRMTVAGPTRLDWTFAVANRSMAQVPADWLPADYDSARQSYELYVPPRREARQPFPVLLYISPSNDPGEAWKVFEPACRQLGMVFAAPRGAGNDCPPRQRVRIVLDVLDDVRRQFPTDPERTYLSGFSGGGRIACAIGFALPELFGGVLPICAGGELREETWLRHRLIDRLSVALVTGTGDFNRGEVERLRGPFLKEVGTRTRVWTQPGLGHGLPSDRVLLEALSWLDEGATKRRDLAKKYPATRAAGGAAPSRALAAKALLAEGKQRIAAKETLYSGLMLLQGVMQRWPDLDAGAEAKKLLLDYEEKPDKSWGMEDIAEQRKYLIAMARALDAYASGELPAQYAGQRGGMARQALKLWQQVLADGPDSAVGREAQKRIPALEKLAGP
jgi:hypothetical protein